MIVFIVSGCKNLKKLIFSNLLILCEPVIDGDNYSGVFF